MPILDKAPPEWKRPSIPQGVREAVLMRMAAAANAFPAGARPDLAKDRIAALINLLGFAQGAVEYDHRPPLSERKFNTETWDTVPSANDPNCIEAITRAEHDRRTNGRGGERRVTTLGSDAHARAKTRHLQNQTAAAPPFDPQPLPRPNQQIRSRGFDRRFTKRFDGTVVPRKERRER